MVSAILSLVITLLLAAPSFAGVVHLKLARAALVSAWLTIVLGVCSSMINPPWRHVFIAASLVGVPAAVVIVFFERWITKQVRQKERPHSAEVQRIKRFYDLLSREEKKILRFILPLHRSPTNLNVGQLTALENIQQKTGFVGRNYTTGSYEINHSIIEPLKILFSSEPPEVEIMFKDKPPFISDTVGKSGTHYSKRRVAVIASVAGKVSLRIPQLSIGKANYPNVQLRPIEHQPNELEADEPGYWEIVQRNVEENFIKILHKGNEEYRLGTQGQFEIVARCSGIETRKIVTVRIDQESNLQFQLDEIGQAPALIDAAPVVAQIAAPKSEKVEESKAKLAGRIICRDVVPVLRGKDELYDCFLILCVKVTNGGEATTVSRFQLDLYWEGVEYPSVKQPVADYYVKVPLSHSDDPQMRFERRPLTEFPYNEEITNANFKMGWVRYKVGTVPLEAIGEFKQFQKEVVLKLLVFDSQDKPHVIYEGSSEELSGCGAIERQEKLALTKGERDQTRKSRHELLEDLVAFRDEGSRLLQKGQEAFTPNLLDFVIQWEAEVGEYVATHIGARDMEDFLSDDDIQVYTSNVKPKVMGRYPASQDLLDRIYTRRIRLKKIIADLQAGRTL